MLCADVQGQGPEQLPTRRLCGGHHRCDKLSLKSQSLHMCCIVVCAEARGEGPEQPPARQLHGRRNGYGALPLTSSIIASKVCWAVCAEARGQGPEQPPARQLRGGYGRAARGGARQLCGPPGQRDRQGDRGEPLRPGAHQPGLRHGHVRRVCTSCKYSACLTSLEWTP